MIANGNFVPCSTLTSERPSKRDMTGRRSDAFGAPMQGYAAEMGQPQGCAFRTTAFGENGNR